MHSTNATDYLDSCADILRPKREAIEKQFTAWMRRNGETAVADLLFFSRERHIEEFTEWIKSLPVRDGDIDADSLPVPFDELVEDAKRLISTPEEIFEEFLKSRDL